MKRMPLVVWSLGMMICAALLLAACGGGGGGSNSPAAVAPTATLAIDDASAPKLVGVAMFGQSVGDSTGSTNILPFQTNEGGSNFSSGLVQTIYNEAREQALSMALDFETAGSASGNDTCPYGGTLSGNLSWDGPNQISSCSDMVNLRGTMTMSNCGLTPSMTMNGRIDLSSDGSDCNPTAMKMTLTGFSVIDNSSNLSFSSQSLVLNVSDLTYTSGGEITHSNSVITGDVSGTVDGMTYDADFYQLTQIVDTNDGFNFSLEISGMLRGGCLGEEWADIDTVQSITFSSVDTCPTAGELLLSGNGQMSVIFNADGSVTVGDTVYPSCDSVDTTCTAP